MATSPEESSAKNDIPGNKEAWKYTIRYNNTYLTRDVVIGRSKPRDYINASDFNKIWDEQQYTCTSCWYHTTDLKLFDIHIKSHKPAVATSCSSGLDSENQSDFLDDEICLEEKSVKTAIREKLVGLRKCFRISRFKN